MGKDSSCTPKIPIADKYFAHELRHHYGSHMAREWLFKTLPSDRYAHTYNTNTDSGKGGWNASSNMKRSFSEADMRVVLGSQCEL